MPVLSGSVFAFLLTVTCVLRCLFPGNLPMVRASPLASSKTQGSTPAFLTRGVSWTIFCVRARRSPILVNSRVAAVVECGGALVSVYLVVSWSS